MSYTLIAIFWLGQMGCEILICPFLMFLFVIVGFNLTNKKRFLFLEQLQADLFLF